MARNKKKSKAKKLKHQKKRGGQPYKSEAVTAEGFNKIFLQWKAINENGSVEELYEWCSSNTYVAKKAISFYYNNDFECVLDQVDVQDLLGQISRLMSPTTKEKWIKFEEKNRGRLINHIKKELPCPRCNMIRIVRYNPNDACHKNVFYCDPCFDMEVRDIKDCEGGFECLKKKPCLCSDVCHFIECNKCYEEEERLKEMDELDKDYDS